MAKHKTTARGVIWQHSQGLLNKPRTPKGSPPPIVTVPVSPMHKRLTLMQLSPNPATVAQISAAYSAMATKPDRHPATTWALLLTLAKDATGVLDTCRACGGSGQVSQPYQHVHCPNCQAVHQPCTCGVERVRPPGFQRVPCADYEQGMVLSDTCHGTGQRRVHNPAPGELSPNTMGLPHAELAQRLGTPDLMAQVAAVLGNITGITG